MIFVSRAEKEVGEFSRSFCLSNVCVLGLFVVVQRCVWFIREIKKKKRTIEGLEAGRSKQVRSTDPGNLRQRVELARDPVGADVDNGLVQRRQEHAQHETNKHNNQLLEGQSNNPLVRQLRWARVQVAMVGRFRRFDRDRGSVDSVAFDLLVGRVDLLNVLGLLREGGGRGFGDGGR